MAYTKKTWVKGSTPLSAENFNHMEQGIADAHTEITQLNSDMSGFRFTWIRLSGTSNSDGIIWCGETGIDLKNVEWIDCLSNTFSNKSLGVLILLFSNKLKA